MLTTYDHLIALGFDPEHLRQAQRVLRERSTDIASNWRAHALRKAAGGFHFAAAISTFKAILLETEIPEPEWEPTEKQIDAYCAVTWPMTIPTQATREVVRERMKVIRAALVEDAQ